MEQSFLEERNDLGDELRVHLAHVESFLEIFKARCGIRELLDQLNEVIGP